MKFETLEQVGILPTMLKFGNTDFLIFKIISQTNEIGFKAWNGRYEAMAQAPLLGTKFDSLAKEFLKDLYFVIDENKIIYLFGDTYKMKDDLKLLGFKWGGYDPVPHWKRSFNNTIGKQLNSKFNYGIPINETQQSKLTEFFSTEDVWKPKGYTMWDHQIQGVLKFINQTYGMLFAWEMGTGKTLGAFSVGKTLKTRTLFVAKASLRLNVYEDAIKFGLKPALLPKPKRKTITIYDDYGNKQRIPNPYIKYNEGEADIIICSYNFVGSKIKNNTIAASLARGFGLIVFDESTYIKNYKSHRTKGSQMLSNAVKENEGKVLFMSGTPIMNAPWEMYTTMKILDPFMESYHKFTEKYNGAHYEQIGMSQYWMMGNPSNLDELHSRLTNTFMDRILKINCLDLPEKMRKEVQLTGIKVNVPEQPKDSKIILGWMAKYKEEVAFAKVDETINLAREAVPCLVFTEYVERVLPTLEHGLKEEGLKVGKIQGSVSFEQRQSFVRAFENGNLDILVIQIKTGGEGLNLPRAKNVIFNDLPWTPGGILQAEDRTHRFDASNRSEEYKKIPITVSMMVADDEFDQKIFGLISSKFNTLKSVIDGDKYEKLSSSSVQAEMRRFFEKKFQLMKKKF